MAKNAAKDDEEDEKKVPEWKKPERCREIGKKTAQMLGLNPQHLRVHPCFDSPSGKAAYYRINNMEEVPGPIPSYRIASSYFMRHSFAGDELCQIS